MNSHDRIRDTLIQVINILHVTLHVESSGVMSGERGGQGSGPSLPIHVPGNFSYRYVRNGKLQ
jgi:hypothetical protein